MVQLLVVLWVGQKESYWVEKWAAMLDSKMAALREYMKADLSADY
jgi:hypothetical protein